MPEQVSDKFSPYLNEMRDLLAFELGSKARVQLMQFPEDSLAHDVSHPGQQSAAGRRFVDTCVEQRTRSGHYRCGKCPFPVVCLSRDHLFYYLRLRWLFEPWLRGDALEIDAEYMVYKITAELAIKFADIDKAVLTFIKAFSRNPIYRLDLNRYDTASPFATAYSFIGMLDYLHEIGHHKAHQERVDAMNDNLGVEIYYTLLKVLFESSYPDSLKLMTLSLTQVLSDEMFSLARLKEEVIADMHAFDGFVRYLQLASSAKQQVPAPGLPADMSLGHFTVRICYLSFIAWA